MKKTLFAGGMMLVVSIACGCLFITGDYASYNLVYIFSFVFLFFFALFSATKVWQKVVQIAIYALIMVAQILINTFLVHPYLSMGLISYLVRFMGVVILFIPFLIDRLFFYQRHKPFIMPVYGDADFISYAFLRYHEDTIAAAFKKTKDVGEVLSKVTIKEAANNFANHSSFSYITGNTLKQKYFELAGSTLGNGYLYLVVAKTRTLPSEIIGMFTGREYNHVSISFDKQLLTVVSYNGGQNIALPGLNPEQVKQLLCNRNAAVMIYRIPASHKAKSCILEMIRKINVEGSAYNLLGLVIKKSFRPNIMFCSQFVYTMLETAGLTYFDKPAAEVKPTDFVELDYYRKLEFCYEISLCDNSFGLEGCVPDANTR